MASASGILANHSALRPLTLGVVSKTAWILEAGADAMSLATATVTSSKLESGVTRLPSAALSALRWASVALWISFGSIARPASRRAVMDAFVAGVFATKLSSVAVLAQSTALTNG